MSKARYWFSAKMRANEIKGIGGYEPMCHTEVMDEMGLWRTYTVMSSKGNDHGCVWDDLVEIRPMVPNRIRINGVIQSQTP